MKTFEKKIFVILKYIFIALPLFISLNDVFNNYIMYKNYQAIVSGENSMQLIEKYENEMDESIFTDFPYVSSQPLYKIISSNNLDKFVPQFSYQQGNVTQNADLFNCLRAKIIGTDVENNRYTGSYFVCWYMSYVVMIELYFMALMLFRFFIHIGIGLFERKTSL